MCCGSLRRSIFSVPLPVLKEVRKVLFLFPEGNGDQMPFSTSIATLSFVKLMEWVFARTNVLHVAEFFTIYLPEWLTRRWLSLLFPPQYSSTLNLRACEASNETCEISAPVATFVDLSFSPFFPPRPSLRSYEDTGTFLLFWGVIHNDPRGGGYPCA